MKQREVLKIQLMMGMKSFPFIWALLPVSLFYCVPLKNGAPVIITVNFVDPFSDSYLRADSLIISSKTGSKIISQNEMECSGYDLFNKSDCNEWKYVLKELDFDSVIVEGFVSKTVLCPKGGYGRLSVPTPERDVGYEIHCGCL